MRRFLIPLLATVLAAAAYGQRLDPADYVYPVLDVSRLYAANFGELRPAHFHAGIDIKTDGVTGKPVVAAADGYVVRIAVSPGGYGRALYIAHPDGTTTVYGHLERFRTDIESYLRSKRYEQGRSNVDFTCKPSLFPVRAGDTVALSGNSGMSFGPHLHFEVRRSSDQRTLNTLAAKLLPVRDRIAPRIMRLHYVEVDSLGDVPVHSRPRTFDVVRRSEGDYALRQTQPVAVGRRGYFIVECSDRKDEVHNTFGIYRLTEEVDGEVRYEYRMDGFLFGDTRYCNAVSYYPMQLSSRNEVIRTAQLAESPACFYPVMVERGIVRTEAGQTRRIRIEAWDDCGNRSQLEFDILGRTESFRAEADSAATALTPERTGIVRLGREVTARIPAGALYEPVFCRAERCPAPASDSTLIVLSPGYRILPATTPLHRAMTVSVRAFVPENLQPHTVLAARNVKGRLTCIGGKYADGAVTATTRTTGELFVVADTIPPRIRPLFTEGADLTRASGMRFRVGDNFSGIASCTLLIDGKWVPCDRLPMQGTLIHLFEEPPARKSHSVRLTLTDACGNTACWEGTIRR